MHYVTFLDDRTQKIGRARRQLTITLRGYNPRTWIPAELSHVTLPVHTIAYSLCPTYRDVFLEVVEGKPRQSTWQRYCGRVIDEVYKLIHLKCEEYASQPRIVRTFDLHNYLLTEKDNIIGEAKGKYSHQLSSLSTAPSVSEVTSLDNQLAKIIRFEAELTSALMNFQIAKVQGANVKRIFDQYFDFNTDLAFRAPHQGFTSDATPDFLYKHRVVGDIKSGKWQEFFEQTVVAYALAYEEHTQENMDYGVIMHVEIPPSRQVPVHYKTRIEVLDDLKRRRYLAVRDRKLQIVATGIDPEKLQSSSECEPGCSFFRDCWGQDDE